MKLGQGHIDLYVNSYYYRLMNTSTPLLPAKLLDQMSKAAKELFSTDSNWAKASGLPKETLSRLKRNPSCDLKTLAALAQTAGYTPVSYTHLRAHETVLDLV